jgi:microcompartment protein CcmL/EutN
MTQAVQLDPKAVDAIGIVETFSVAAAVLAADRSVKAAEVRLIQMRLARGLGGRAFYVMTGELHQLQAAVSAGATIIHDGMLLTTEIIPRPHPDLVRQVCG